MKTIKHLLALLLLLSAWQLPAQPAPPASEAPAPAQAAPPVAQRSFSPERLKSYRDNPDYRYLRDNATPPKREVDDYEPRYTSRPPIEVKGPRGDFSGFFQVIFWVLIVGLVAYILYQLVQVKFGKLWKKKSDEAIVEITRDDDEIEDIRNVEFDDAVQQAIDAKRYRVAVRLLYLRSLRQLQDRAMINWRREKTNRDYLYELSDARLRPLFSDLTFMFEYIWYGEFPVDQNHFATAHAGFKEFDNALHQRDAK
jgi:hypothetical protein